MHLRQLTLLVVAAAVLIAPHLAAAEPKPAQIKNVLFIISDDLKASVLGCYGDKICRTPNIDKLANDGMLFERAYCQHMSCSPSRKSFMFSRYEGATGVNMGQHFKENGWYSGRVSKIYHMRVPGDIIAGTDGGDVASSWTEKFNSQGQEAHTPGDYACLNQNIFTKEEADRQSTRMPHRMFVTVEYNGDGSDQPDHKSATKAVELLQKHKDHPFFLAVGLVRPHYPMVAPRQYFAPYPHEQLTVPEVPKNDLDDIPRKGWAATRNAMNPIGMYPDNQQRMWRGYYAAVQFMDEQVGRIIAELDRLRLRESTAIVFTSDHGYHLGEHTFWQKSNLHEEVTRIPLIIATPNNKPGRSKALVELMDIFPTLSDLAGLATPETVQGKSLVPVLMDSEHSVRDAALSLHQGGACLRTADWAYLRYGDGSEELYNMQLDPGQFHNLAYSQKHAEPKTTLALALTKRLGSVRPTKSNPKPKKRKSK